MLYNNYFKSTLRSTFGDINEFCVKHGSRVYLLGTLCIENYAIIEQDFGFKVHKYIDSQIHNALKKSCRNEVFAAKIDYNSFLFNI